MRILLLKNTKLNNQIVVKFRNVHKFLGITMYLLAKSNLVIGTYLLNDELLI